MEKDLLDKYRLLKEFFNKLYNLYTPEKINPPKRLNGKLYPYIFIDTQFDIEVEVYLSTVNLDVRHEEDDYAHALRYACIPLVDNPEVILSELFDTAYIQRLFDQKMFFDDMKRYVYPYKIFEKGEGYLRHFISTSFSEDSFFSYRHFLASLFAHKDKTNMYLSYKGKILIKEEEHLNFLKRLSDEFNKLSKIYQQYYKDEVTKFYSLTDQYIAKFLKIDISQQLNEEELSSLNHIYDLYPSLKERYDLLMSSLSVEKYINKKTK